MQLKKEEPSSSCYQEQSSWSNDSLRVKRSYSRGRGSRFVKRCYKCNEYGHRSYKYLENHLARQGSAHIAQENGGSVN